MAIGQWKLGSVIQFRYKGFDSHDPAPLVLVISSNVPPHGNLHGLNLRYLTPLEQSQIQYYFTPTTQRSGTINPFSQQQAIDYRVQQQRTQQAQEYERKKAEMLEQQEGVVVKPKPGSIFGVSTFVRTAKMIIDKTRHAFGYLSRFKPFGGQQAVQPEPPPPSPLANVAINTAPTINSPYEFYHTYVKKIIRGDPSRCYRQYRQQFGNTTRLVRGPRA
jgi:hypothetical protein